VGQGFLKIICISKSILETFFKAFKLRRLLEK